MHHQMHLVSIFAQFSAIILTVFMLMGISITHGANPRKHIWTYAGAFKGNFCPCAGGTATPTFVGSDYYCESGLDTLPFAHVLYSNDTLWDGQDYGGLEGTCCDSPNLPWFCKVFPEPTNDNLELHICGDQSLVDEDTPIELVQLYIQ